jgi:ribonucleoside-diphosphate reductase beta chain
MLDQAFVTTTRGLDRDHPALRLYEKAKRYGTWNPSEIDFTRDALDWARLDDAQRDLILRLTSVFQAGEEAVTLDVLPLVLAVAREGRVEEEMFLATFLFEEAKHTDFFNRFLAQVTGGPQNLNRYHGESYRTLIYDMLPTAMWRLVNDASPVNQIRAAITYNMVTEGMLAETGYHIYQTVLERNGLMPEQCNGIRLVKQDESRHIAYGVYLISRHLAADPALWQVFDETMNGLLPVALGIIAEAFATYADEVPFGIVESDFVDYALGQFGRRYERIEKARGAAIDEVDRFTARAIEEEA